jgi:hypothetical protein
MSIEMSLRGDEETGLLDEPPMSEGVTLYDREHFATYLSLLYAAGEGHSDEMMALGILGINPALEPERATRALDSHLKRARWLADSGYKFLLESRSCEDSSPA